MKKRISKLRNYIFKYVNWILAVAGSIMIILYFSKLGFTVDSVKPSVWFNELSSDPSDWASFGAYMTPVFMMATIMVMFHTIQVGNEKERKAKEIERFQELYKKFIALNNLFQKWHIVNDQKLKKIKLLPDNKNKTQAIKDIKENYEKESEQVKDSIYELYNDFAMLVNLYFQNEVGGTVTSLLGLIHQQINRDNYFINFKYEMYIQYYNEVNEKLKKMHAENKIYCEFNTGEYESLIAKDKLYINESLKIKYPITKD